ncbi:hypothetical protein HCN44_004492 [Aphidius gifuensis]|uniref:Odorant receptor n=1 Tax=Aphidius gifuensis TaxID=684658 RepID=A0A834XZN6_APHGI|nr:hypothetical protein HCN44_004492 [Aphidius gifuensis]
MTKKNNYTTTLVKNKKNYKIDQHISLRMIRLLMKCIGMWHPKTTQDAIISMTITVYTITAQSIGLIVMLIDIYYIFGDIRAIAFNIPVTVSIIQELFKMITFTINRGEVQSLNKYTEETFWKSKYDESEILILKKCNKVCIVSCGIFFFLVLAIAIHYITIPMLEYDGGNLSLPFNVYFEASKYTPIFEICYFIQAASTIGVSVCSTAFCTYLFTINVYAAGLFQILQRKLIQTCQKYSYKKTNDGLTSSERTKLSYERLKKCIQHHQVMIKYMDTIEYLYSPINFIFAIGAVGTICLNGFQVVMGGENSFHRNALSIEFFIGSIVLLYMACYSCQKIFVESLAVGDNLYNANFYDLSNEEEGKYFRQALIFVIMRSQKPCVLTMWGFSVMSIEIFTKVLTKSMSFFTIFRQIETIDKHVSLKMTRFFMKCIGMWYPKNSREKLLSNLIIIYTVTTQVIALIILSIDFYHVRTDIRAIAFNLPVTSTIIQELLKISRFSKHIKHVRFLNSYSENFFWKIQYDSSELMILEKCNKICILFCGTFFFFILAIDTHYLTIPLIEYDDSIGRQLPFKVYFELNDLWYKIFYITLVLSTFGVTVCTTAFISHLFTINIYAAGQFQILQRKIELAFKITTNFENEKQENLQKCIEKHQILIQYVKLIDHLYSPIIFMLAIAAISTICLTGFQLVTGVNTTFHRNALSFEFFFATIVMLFMACYSCQEIIEESLGVGDAAFSALVDIYDLTHFDNRNAFIQYYHNIG